MTATMMTAMIAEKVIKVEKVKVKTAMDLEKTVEKMEKVARKAAESQFP